MGPDAALDAAKKCMELGEVRVCSRRPIARVNTERTQLDPRISRFRGTNNVHLAPTETCYCSFTQRIVVP